MILEIDNIELSFSDRKILYGIYIKAETGQITGVLGRNGCGKTCLLRILFGNLSSKYKNVRINGEHQFQPLYKSNIIGYLPQHQLLLPNMIVCRAFAHFNLNWSEFVRYFDAFEKYKNSRVKYLSSGELRVIETYLILFSDKKVILLDEPFSFIVPLYVEKFKLLMNEIKREKVIIVTDHFYRDILGISDKLYLIKTGYSKLITNENELQNEGYLLPGFNDLNN